MDQLAVLIGVAIFLGIVFALGDLAFRTLAGRLDARLRAGWRWLTLPVTAILSFGGFAVIRPLILDQPRTLSWFLLGSVAIALLVSGATAMAMATVALGRAVVRFLQGR